MRGWRETRLGWHVDTIVPQRDKPTDLTGGIPWLRIEDFDGKYISSSKSGQGVSREQVSAMPLRVFPAGTVVTSCSCTMGATAIAGNDLVTNQTFIGLVPRSSELTADFLYYLMQAKSEELQTQATGSIQQYLSQADFQRLRFLMPGIGEQVAIATFLDRETAQIDLLIEKQHALIDRLRERRQVTIDTALPWNRTAQLRRDLKFLTSGSRGWGDYYSDTGPVFLRIANLNRGRYTLRTENLQRVDLPGRVEGSRAMTEAGDLLFSITAYLGSVAVVPPELGGAYVSQHVALARLAGRLWEPEFVAYAALSSPGQRQLNEQAYGGTKVQLSLTDVREFVVPLAARAEQRAISDRLDRETERIDSLIAKAERFIELARERRSALITAAVTGQMDTQSEVE